MNTRFPIVSWTESVKDSERMRQALLATSDAAQAGEVPIGACLYVGDECLAITHNLTVSSHDPTAHAEVLALRQAAQRLKNHRVGGTLYVTLQPCMMCLGALMNARVSRVVIGAADSRFNTQLNDSLEPFRQSEAWHNCRFEVDCLPLESQTLLKSFFLERRRDREQTLGTLKALIDLLNVNKNTVRVLNELSIFSGLDILQRGVASMCTELEAHLPSLGQLKCAQDWDSETISQQQAILLSVCDFLNSKSVKSWTEYLPQTFVFSSGPPQ